MTASSPNVRRSVRIYHVRCTKSSRCEMHHMPWEACFPATRCGTPFFPKQFTVRGSQFFLKMCPPFSAGHAAFLFICLPGDFFTFVSQVRCLHCWCPPFSAGHAAFLFICFPCNFFPSVSRVRCLFRWPCCSSIHLSPMCLPYFCLPGSVPALLVSTLSTGHAAFLFYSFVSLPQTGYC